MKIKRFIDCNIPVMTCNFRCHYCYIAQHRLFDKALPSFPYSAEHMAKSLSVERLGGECLINMCGNGETLLPPEMTDIIRCFLEEGHYVNVITNGTVSKRFDEIVALPSTLLKRLFFKFSFHFLELERTKRMESFFANIEKVRKAGCSFSLEITPNDELLPRLEEIKQVCMDHVGALCHVTVARDETKPQTPVLSKLSEEEYKKVWGQFDSKMFSFKLPLYEQKRTEYCYAGDWSLCLFLGTGELRQCYRGATLVKNVFENTETPIPFRAIGKNCKEPHCYNGHAFLTFGVIPELKTPCYIEMRDRTVAQGQKWLTSTYEDFFTSKLVERNTPYSPWKKLVNYLQNKWAKIESKN